MLRIGILGAAGIAPRSIIQPARRRTDVVIHGVASRRLEAGKQYGELHKIEKVYESYDAMLADPDIDLVYNALPPAGHAEWSIAALEAGKHVLCEKPIAMTSQEAMEMFAVSKRTGKILMEAFHDRYHPVFMHLLELKKGDNLGTIRSVKAEFYVDIPFDKKSIRHDPTQGGGCMMDLGCYPLHWLRNFFGTEPHVLAASAKLTTLGVDESMDAKLRFGSIDAELIADIARPPFEARIKVVGDRGSVEIDNPVLPHKGHSIRETIDGILREFTLAGGTTYDYQLDAFLDAVETGTAPHTGETDAINNMRALEEIYRIAGMSVRGRP
ncbi:Gfo/Idh/MocA family protein [Agrobacterium rosae]|uniref:Gfo/Idh/MocA family oxidoreductase n=1 Tax=Agrobacterium rosae TaxID=1972867 RepID=A0AAW9FRF6_9HYPH|nr:Gfo/Idh/MocA family oxidoreductase [Agrobacterium rosae]MDX8305440.1 Gfo/Idh/MocA family oxidoreductase [Agrobacterium rosae]